MKAEVSEEGSLGGESPSFDAKHLAAKLLDAQPILGEKIARSCQTEDPQSGLVEVLRFLALVAENTELATTDASNVGGALTPSHRVDLA